MVITPIKITKKLRLDWYMNSSKLQASIMVAEVIKNWPVELILITNSLILLLMRKVQLKWANLFELQFIAIITTCDDNTMLDYYIW